MTVAGEVLPMEVSMWEVDIFSDVVVEVWYSGIDEDVRVFL